MTFALEISDLASVGSVPEFDRRLAGNFLRVLRGQSSTSSLVRVRATYPNKLESKALRWKGGVNFTSFLLAERPVRLRY